MNHFVNNMSIWLYFRAMSILAYVTRQTLLVFLDLQMFKGRHLHDLKKEIIEECIYNKNTPTSAVN